METKNKYQGGKIYTIRSHKTDKYYIGSTTQPLSRRFSGHKRDHLNHLDGKRKDYTSSFELIAHGDAYIELLENFPCNSKDELTKREGELIRQHKNSIVNMLIPHRTVHEWYLDNIDKIKEYEKANKEKISAYQKQYRIDNVERAKQLNKQYNKKHKEQVKAIQKQWREENKKIIIQCECGGDYNKASKSDHLRRSKKHLDYVNSLKPINE